jgi:hypothetical protein
MYAAGQEVVIAEEVEHIDDLAGGVSCAVFCLMDRF